MNALIGHTGFVGGNILNQFMFEELYNSSNIKDIRNKEFDLLVCAGTPGTKWMANTNPHEDWRAIEKLITNLDSVKINKAILISTIDVYPITNNKSNESHNIEPIQPYGFHRWKLEQFFKNKCPNTKIVRLPGLFGSGLKKNLIYDLMNHKGTINPYSQYQWYPIKRLWKDIQKCTKPVINLFPEPILNSKLLHFFPKASLTEDIKVEYNLQTLYSEIYNGPHGYIMTQEEVLKDLNEYINI